MYFARLREALRPGALGGPADVPGAELGLLGSRAVPGSRANQAFFSTENPEPAGACASSCGRAKSTHLEKSTAAPHRCSTILSRNCPDVAGSIATPESLACCLSQPAKGQEDWCSVPLHISRLGSCGFVQQLQRPLQQPCCQSDAKASARQSRVLCCGPSQE